MTRPFQPIGDQARWRVLYELLCQVETDGLLSYEAMGAALNLDPEEQRHTIQLAMRRAAREHEARDKRAVESVPNVGYRVVLPPEHLRLAQSQQKRASKALVRGHSKVVNVDFNGLEPDVRRSFEVVGQLFAMQMDFNRRTDVRQRRLETVVESVTERTNRTEEELTQLRERLARLEAGGGDPAGEE